MDRSVPVVFALLGVVLGVFQAVQQFMPTLLPRPSTAGPLLFAFSVVLFLVDPCLVFALGYWSAGPVDVASEYPRYLAVVGVTVAVGFLVGWLAAFAVGPFGAFAGSPVQAGFGTAYNAVARGVGVALTSLAGAAVATFRTTNSERKT